MIAFGFNRILRLDAIAVRTSSSHTKSTAGSVALSAWGSGAVLWDGVALLEHDAGGTVGDAGNPQPQPDAGIGFCVLPVRKRSTTLAAAVEEVVAGVDASAGALRRDGAAWVPEEHTEMPLEARYCSTAEATVWRCTPAPMPVDRLGVGECTPTCDDGEGDAPDGDTAKPSAGTVNASEALRAT